MTLSELELGWLAGLLEGEGYFGYAKGTPVIGVRMTDEDTMIRLSVSFTKITGVKHKVGQIGQPMSPRKEIYYMQLYGRNARAIMLRVVPFMSDRRRQQIWRALNKYTPPKVTLDGVLSSVLK